MEISDFDFINFKDSLYNGLIAPVKIQKNPLVRSVYDFISGIRIGGERVKSIVVEADYFSESFFYDYQNYYLHSHFKDAKTTSRIHFFATHFTDEEDFKSKVILCKNNRYRDSYAGNIVVKPTTNISLGVCFFAPEFKSKPEDQLTCLRSFEFNLYGVPLKVEGTVFLPQDSTIGGCATSALWTAFFRASDIFRTKFPAPSEITIAAGLNSNGSRLFPSKRLENRQIARALEKFNLTAQMFVRSKKMEKNREIINNSAKRVMYAYLRAGIPVLYGYNIYTYQLTENQSNNKPTNDDVTLIRTQRHMTTLVGYRHNSINQPKKREFRDLITKADSVERFFMINDQFGPHDFMKFKGAKFKIESSHFNSVNQKHKHIQLEGSTQAIIIPLKKEIRIGYSDIENSVRNFASFLNTIDTIKKYNIQGNLIWDIYITKSNEYKKQVLELASILDSQKTFVAEISFPKFIWVARLVLEGKSKTKYILDLTYDPSDSPTGFCGYKAIFFDGETQQLVYSGLTKVINQGELDQIVTSAMTENHYKMLLSV